MKQDLLNEAVLLLQRTKIFQTADAGALKNSLSSGGELCGYKRGDIIFSGGNYKPSLGLLLKGKANVSKGRAAISTLEPGCLFGAVTLFGSSPHFAAEITAASECKVLFINRGAVSALMAQNSAIAESYIEYLSQRIYFLTGKIEAFTAGSAESRLANYLLNSHESRGEAATVTVNTLSGLAKELDIGRASLYRAFDVLTSAGAIRREGRKIILLDTEKLLNNS